MKQSDVGLARDIARCSGADDSGELLAVCKDCRRRTDRSTFPLQVWMAPPIIDGECDYRIAPTGERK